MIEFQKELLTQLATWARQNFGDVRVNEELMMVTVDKGYFEFSIAVRGYHYALALFCLKLRGLHVHFSDNLSTVKLELESGDTKLKLEYRNIMLGMEFVDADFSEIAKSPVSRIVLPMLQALPISLQLYAIVERIIKSSLGE
ncbi:hypothetical protein D878_gp36 [Sulfolobales Mexican rudivirus 1]|jgi:hypothetical protein|uniref:Uncharacterized protein n=1 Tax=Sulfolobales Mexican rod-shaped virus 1 TaxID=2848122 RepID=K4NZC2_9VIRU|nr:hypothetical protein D878_gp36 [Sulfolobales Mexican rudivirus 1]AFV51263.1 hypothetical protein [Sulfolobales Mexican rod-shaped virus 1]